MVIVVAWQVFLPEAVFQFSEFGFCRAGGLSGLLTAKKLVNKEGTSIRDSAL